MAKKTDSDNDNGIIRQFNELKKKQRNDSYHLVLMNCNTPLSEAAVWSLPLWGRGGG